jgi:uncharacterized membrane protein (DUF485 family)
MVQEGGQRIDWHAIADSEQFRALEAARRRMLAATLGVFGIAVGVFLILCGYARPFMRRSVDGGLTVAYVWLLALTVLAWVLVYLYLRFAGRRLEPAARKLVEQSTADGEREAGTWDR